MPALKPTNHYAEVTFIGVVEDRDLGVNSLPATSRALVFGGFSGEAHGGLTRPACSRVSAQYPRNIEIANTRQLSVLGFEELAAIASEMGIDALDPSLIGASLVLKGLPDFTRLPPSSRLIAPSGASIVVDMENRPCSVPHDALETAYPGYGARFKAAANGRRGITAWVERPGLLHLGDKMRLHVPDQPVWGGQA